MAGTSSVEIVMPRMGLTMEEGTVVSWLKAVGEPVKAGEPLLEIETDKATVEIESPREGVLSQVLAEPGTTVPIGTVIGYLAEKGAVVSPRTAPVSAAAPSHPAEPAQPQPFSPPIASSAADGVAGKVRASPAARRLARHKGIDLAGLKGSGPGGRVVAWNVEAAVAQAAAAQAEAAQAAQVTPVAQRAAQELGVDLSQVQGSGPGGRVTRQDVERLALMHVAEQPAVQRLVPPAAPAPQKLPEAWPGAPVVPLSRFQKIMAERMTGSFTSAPHFYLHVETDARPLLALRQSLLPKLEARYNVHLTITDLLVKFCAQALEHYPNAMAQFVGDGLRQPQQVNIGVAVDTPNGLVVPVIRDCNRLGLSEIASRRMQLVEKAREGKLVPEDLELGVFTISNLGTFAVDYFDAILNPPQAAILAVGRIKERALAEAGQVIAAPTMLLSLSVDHRVLDGAAAARFLGDLVELIETPGLALG